MTMDGLHGYLTALAIGPRQVAMTTWLPRVWGSAEGGPSFANAKEAARITHLIGRFMNEILMTFDVAPKDFEPLFCEFEWEGKMLIDGEAWAWGFWEGMNLCADDWESAWQSNIAELLTPIYLLGAEEIEEEEMSLVDEPVKRHKLAIEVEAAIPHIHRYWQPLRKSAIETVQRAAAKVGRNDDCPCGSGKKFKKCCGDDAAAL